MAKPILEIPINDEKFKAFLELFNKYKSEVARLPEIWKGTNEEIIAQISTTDSLIGAIDKQTKALLDQQEVLHKHTLELEKQARIEDKREKAETKERKDKEKADKKAIEDTKKIAGNIAKATVNIIKWGALDFLVAGAADLWGLGAISRNVADQLAAARGVNVSIGQNRALADTFGYLFDTQAALERGATAQTDITQSIPYRILGLNPNSTNPAELSIETARAIKQRLQGIPQQFQMLYAHALGLDTLETPDEIRRGLNTPWSVFNAEQYGTKNTKGETITYGYEALQKILDISPQTAQGFTLLSQQLRIAGHDIEAHFAAKLVAFAPEVDKLIKGFAKLTDDFIDKIDWQNLSADFTTYSNKVIYFFEHVDWKGLETDFGRAKVDLEGFATGMEKVLRFFHLIPDQQYTPGTPAYEHHLKRDIIAQAVPVAVGVAEGFTPGGANASTAAGVAGALAQGGQDIASLAGFTVGSISDKDEIARAQYGYNYLRGLGWSPAAALGIISSASLESDLRTNAPGDFVNGRPTAFGISQEHEQGQADYRKLFPGHTLGENSAGEYERELQLISYELKQGDKVFANHLRELLQTNDPAQAGYLIRKFHERPKFGEAGGREAAARARQLANQLKIQVVVTAPPGHNVSTQAGQASQ